MHDLCFNETGARTEYLNSLIEEYTSVDDGKVDFKQVFKSLNEECKKFRKEPAISLDSQQRDIGGVICQESEGMDLESIDYNIQLMMKVGLNIDSILDTVSVKKAICNNNQYLSILLIKGTSSDHAVVLVKKDGIVSIIDPLSIKSEFSSSLEEIKKDLIASGTKSVNVVYSNLQQINSGTCADISLILIKNILDKVQSIQAIKDITKIIGSIRAEMYNTSSAAGQKIVSLVNEEKLQNTYIYDHKYNNHENNITTSLPIIGRLENAFYEE
ncbi:MAG: hypothetical protein RCO49_08735 [Rickettsia endosymbiont of Argas persicus]